MFTLLTIMFSIFGAFFSFIFGLMALIISGIVVFWPFLLVAIAALIILVVRKK